MREVYWRLRERGAELRRRALYALDSLADGVNGWRDRTRSARKPAPAKLRGPAGPAPTIPDGRRVYAVGDIHGRADLLRRLVDAIAEDVRRAPPEAGRPILIFLGDYVDRGFQSREVIDYLIGDRLAGFETYFLKGNHEAAMMQFFEDPSIGPRWAEYGGVETLVSYGVRPPRSRSNADDWVRACQELKRAVPAEHVGFLRNLSLSVRIGGYLFVHAGVRPGRAIDQQSEYDMLWIREDFLSDGQRLEAVVVHGHTPAAAPYRDHRRIGLDTGAYLSGKLTAGRFERDQVDFLTTSA